MANSQAEEFDAEEFIDGWSESVDWRVGLASKKFTPAELMRQLRDLDAAEPTEGVDWDEVESELWRWVEHQHRPDAYHTEHCAECGAKL